MVLRKCSVKAISLCPDAKICCTQRHPAEFAEGSECHKFNEEVESLFTNADRIRSMTDEEMAEFLFDYPYCPFKKPHCRHDNCLPCYLKWLKQPEEKEDGNKQ